MQMRYGVTPKKSILVISPDCVPLSYHKDKFSELPQDQQELFLNKCTRPTSLGQRAWNTASELAKHFNVTLAVPDHNFIHTNCINTSELFFKVVSYNYDSALKDYSFELEKLTDDYDIIVLQSSAVGFVNAINLPASKTLVLDAWIPLGIERSTSIAYVQGGDDFKEKLDSEFFETYLRVLKRADIILYANQSQRFYYLGLLNGIHEISYKNFKHSKLLKVGISVPKVEPLDISYKRGDTFNLVWFGTTYPWYNPFILIEAFEYLKNENISLTFIGFSHPRFKRLNNENLEKALDGKNIKISRNYLDMQDLDGYHLAVILAYNYLEAQVAHRYRSLQLGALGIPVCTNKQDNAAHILQRYGLAYEVLTSSPENLAKSIVEIRNAYQPPTKSLVKNYQNSLSATKCFEPLVGILLGEEKWKLM